jgi:multisubunit Na+/H+ antiporter MnhF subunit
MVHDALPAPAARGAPAQEERWRKAFRLTVQKSLLGAVIGATGTRAIYYTVRDHIEEKWADILLHIYYPALLSAFSLLILFWAEIFYQSAAPSENHVFLKKHKYSLTFFLFNGLVYLLLLAEVVATPLVHDDSEQVRKSGIIGIIFAILLFFMLVGFLHLAIRLFFRPDWQPLVLQLEALKINLKQHTLSCLGIVTNALMQVCAYYPRGVLIIDMSVRSIN